MESYDLAPKHVKLIGQQLHGHLENPPSVGDDSTFSKAPLTWVDLELYMEEGDGRRILAESERRWLEGDENDKTSFHRQCAAKALP